ncbi:hypothetical protein C8R44DRAFT_986940 [Mycena epipterygia]|nr:hypothetical protein C8R44DRAFT_986940 [Mycena epipterygia]
MPPSPDRSCWLLDFVDAFMPSRSMWSLREIHVNAQAGGAQHDTRVRDRHMRRLGQPPTLVHWSAFLNSTMLPQRLRGILSAFAPAADRRPTAADPAHVRYAATADTALPPAVAAIAFGANTPLPSPPVPPALCASAPLAWSDTILRPVDYGSRTPPRDVSLRCSQTIPYRPPPDAFLSTPHPATALAVARSRACPAEIWQVLGKENGGMDGSLYPWHSLLLRRPARCSTHDAAEMYPRRMRDVARTQWRSPRGEDGTCGRHADGPCPMPSSRVDHPNLYWILEPTQRVPFPSAPLLARGWLRLPDHLLTLQSDVDMKSYAYLCVTSPGTSPEM